MIDFSNNINFIGPPAGFESKVVAQDLLFYPDYQQKNVSLSIGATEAISITARLSSGKAGSLCPTFWEYEHFYTLYHGIQNYKKYYLSHANDFAISEKNIIAHIDTHAITTFYIANPNNPTTTILDKNTLLSLITLRPNVVFVIDETYLMFSSNYDELSLTKEAASLPNLVVITSLSKIFALPGLRLGIVVSNATYMEEFRNQLVPYGIPLASQNFAPWLLQQNDFLIKARQEYRREGDLFKERLEENMLKQAKVYSSLAPFFLIQLKSDLDLIQKFYASLAEHEIIIRSGKEFETLDESWIRVAIKRSSENNAFANLLQANV